MTLLESIFLYYSNVRNKLLSKPFKRFKLHLEIFLIIPTRYLRLNYRNYLYHYVLVQ